MSVTRMDSPKGDTGNIDAISAKHKSPDINSVNSLQRSQSREDRMKRLREQSELEIQRKHNEIMESNKVSNELRQRLQEDRRKKIEELKQREEDRKRRVEERRQEMMVKERERNESTLKRTKEREARVIMTQSVPGRMTGSMYLSGQSNGGGGDGRGGGGGGMSDRCRASVDRLTMSSTATSNTRHAGCLMPCRDRQERVKGVLSWGPSRASVVSARGASVAWWEAVGPSGVKRAASAHSAHVSTPQNLHKTTDVSGVDSGTSKDTARSPRVPSATKVTKSMSLRYLGPTIASSNQNKDPDHKKEVLSPRSRPPSSSASVGRPQSSGAEKTGRVGRPPSSGREKTTATATDAAVFTRLSQPRSGSQPAKPKQADQNDAPTSVMSISMSRPPVKASLGTPSIALGTRRSPKKPVVPEEKRPSPKAQPPPSAPDSGVPSSPVGEKDPPQAPPQTVAPLVTTATPSISNKSGKESTVEIVIGPESAGGAAAATESKAVASVEEREKETYRAKMAEQRRLAREAKERQEEEQRRAEEEGWHRAQEERRRAEEEARQMVEEEARRQGQLEEQERDEAERLRLQEETSKLKKEEEEQSRVARLQAEESERQERKRRLETIMSRVKKPDDGGAASGATTNEDSGAADEASAMTGGTVAGPEEDKAAPKFKSRLLQSMVTGGRLAADGRRSSLAQGASTLSLVAQGLPDSPQVPNGDASTASEVSMSLTRSCYGALGHSDADYDRPRPVEPYGAHLDDDDSSTRDANTTISSSPERTCSQLASTPPSRATSLALPLS